jgi:hypothetical protein
MSPVERHTIFLTLAGSQAHGTAREGSDVDLRGVCIAPLPARLSLFTAFEQYEGPLPDRLAPSVLQRLRDHPTASRGIDVGTECVIFDLAKFLRLCANANPNALEIMFADELDWAFETPEWRALHRERQGFLTRKVRQTFLGYAMAQLRRIRTHRSWLLDPPTKRPTREDFGLPEFAGTLSTDDQNRIEQSIAGKVHGYGVDDIGLPESTRIAVQGRMEAFYRDVLSTSADHVTEGMRTVAGRALDVPTGVMATLDAERRYRAAIKQWDSYQAWKRERNPARAELERKHGYDTKHAMHLIRLMRMGLEALQEGVLRVRRPDADELNAIRDGALPFDELLAATTHLGAAMEAAADGTKLPDDVNPDLVDRLAFRLMSGTL